MAKLIFFGEKTVFQYKLNLTKKKAHIINLCGMNRFDPHLFIFEIKSSILGLFSRISRETKAHHGQNCDFHHFIGNFANFSSNSGLIVSVGGLSVRKANWFKPHMFVYWIFCIFKPF